MTDSPVVDILLVEDNPADVELTRRALRKANIANPLRVVDDGAAAIEYLLEGSAAAGRPKVPPRLVLLDLKLPKVDGLEVLRRIKGDERTRAVPVVVLTASREERDIVESYHLGANSYIVKPVDFDKFVEAVSQLGLYWLLLNTTPETFDTP
jgi:two-component system, response regulator